MKKDTLFFIITALGVYFAWRTFKLNKQLTETVTKKANTPTTGGGGAGSYTGGGTNPEDPTHEPEIEVKVTMEDCPYCGTQNAQITRTYKDGVLVKTEVACGNKSCPGHPVVNPTDENYLTSKSHKIITLR